MSICQCKNLKGLKKEELRDSMTTLELVLNMLAAGLLDERESGMPKKADGK